AGGGDEPGAGGGLPLADRRRRPHQVGDGRDQHHGAAGPVRRAGQRRRAGGGRARGARRARRRAGDRGGRRGRRRGRGADGEMRRTSARLSDGREIIYFDEAEGRPEPPADPRGLPPHEAAPEARFDPLLREWVVMAAHRQGRTHLPPSDACPLCPSTPDRPTEVPAPDYDVVAFERRFPSLASGSGAGPEDALEAVGELEPSRRPAAGRCEVLCFSSDHRASFTDLPPERVRTIVDAWADRTAALSALPGAEQVFCFENRGAEIGVTLPHPHGQIYAYPFTTPRTERMLASAREYRERTGGDLLADNLAAERRAGLRVVAESGHWTAFVPAAARWPVEVHLYPRRRA